MTREPDPTVRIRVDPTNPGQFFACCGLLELADRLWGGAEGWFADDHFLIGVLGEPKPDRPRLEGLLKSIRAATLVQLDPVDDYESPIELGEPFRIILDWWKDTRSGGRALKVWAGRMGSFRIARAMEHSLQQANLHDGELLDYAAVVFDPGEPDKKVEPFYFDARRGSNARSVDLGFSPDALGMTIAAYPAVEFLCLVGLQRHRPTPTAVSPRTFDYHTWAAPLEVRVAPAAVCGLLPNVGGGAYRFENAFRTDQKKHKGFRPATVVERRER